MFTPYGEKQDVMSEKTKTCYTCEHRGEVSGSCHSSCRFDWGNSEHTPPKGNSHGIKSGWYNFPFNFDPVWQKEECKEHSSK